jgi:hypothetical protein
MIQPLNQLALWGVFADGCTLLPVRPMGGPIQRPVGIPIKIRKVKRQSLNNLMKAALFIIYLCLFSDN